MSLVLLPCAMTVCVADTLTLTGVGAPPPVMVTVVIYVFLLYPNTVKVAVPVLPGAVKVMLALPLVIVAEPKISPLNVKVAVAPLAFVALTA